MVKIYCSRENGEIKTEITLTGEQERVADELEALRALLEGMTR